MTFSSREVGIVLGFFEGGTLKNRETKGSSVKHSSLKKSYQPPEVKKHTAKETIRILTGATTGSSTATFAAV